VDNKFDHISRVLCDRLHWLPVEQRIQYKLCLLVYKAQCGLAPQYLVDFCQPVSAVSGRSGLRSFTRGDLVVVWTETDFGECSFAVAAPLAWNRLPEEIRNLQSLQCLSLVSRLTCSAALPDTGKQDTDTGTVTADISRPCNGFAMLWQVINWRIY